jgi:hypothetical protein
VAGDIHGANMLLNIVEIANAVCGTIFWVPTREITTVAAVRRQLADLGLPWQANLIDRNSAPMIYSEGTYLTHCWRRGPKVQR